MPRSWPSPLERDSRGYESQFATNHLGHFQLLCRLWPALVAAQGARVVMLSSLGHRITPVNFDDPNFERREYHKWKAYGQAKTANSLCASARTNAAARHGIRAFAVHPGAIMTDLQRSLSLEEQVAMGWITADGVVSPIFKIDRARRCHHGVGRHQPAARGTRWPVLRRLRRRSRRSGATTRVPQGCGPGPSITTQPSDSGRCRSN